MIKTADAVGKRWRPVRFVLIEFNNTTQIDKDVLPAVIEFTLQEILGTRRGVDGSNQPDIAFVCLDRNPEEYDKPVRRCMIPRSSVIDGFSDWFSATKADVDMNYVAKGHRQSWIHIGDIDPTSQVNGSLLKEVSDVFARSPRAKSTEKIAVLDSLSSLQRFWPDIQQFLRLRDELYKASCRLTADCYLTLICTFQSIMSTSVQLSALKKLADVHVHVQQGKESLHENHVDIPKAYANREHVTMTVARLKDSGRVHLDYYDGIMDWENQKLNGKKLSLDTNDQKNRASKVESEREYQESLLKDLGLSFRVDLSASEKEVRAAAGLPYLHQDEALADSALKLHPRELQIGYQPTSVGDEEASDTDSEEELFSEDV